MEDITLLFDVEQPDFGSDMSSSMRSDVEDDPIWGRAVMGEGRLMTPANSQEIVVRSPTISLYYR